MATKTRKKPKQAETDEITSGLSYLTDDEAAEFERDSDEHQDALKRMEVDAKEAMLISKLGDSVSASFKSRVTDSRLSTLALEGSARCMAQIPTGTTQAMTKKDTGKSALMSLSLTKYIQPNDNTQYDHLTKMRLVNLYSRVYGVQAVLCDISVSERYLGPATWLLPIRSWIPQPGKLSIEDSDRNHVETWVSAGWLEDQKGNGSWNSTAIDFIAAKTKEGGGQSKTAQPAQKRSVTERARQTDVPGGEGRSAQVRLITRYESGKEGRWKTFAPEYNNLIVRDRLSRKGRIPIRIKHHYPLIDSIYGLGQFERGKTLQYASDSLNAMYLAAVQMGIFPPRIIQQDGVVLESLNYGPGETWTETKPNSIRNFQVSPAGLETFQATSQWLTGAMLNQNGATDTSQTVQTSLDPTAGRTPQALKMQQSRESAADAWDVYMQEKFLEGLYEDMINLLPDVPKPFTLHIFDAEIKQLRDAGMEDVMEVFDSQKAASATINPKDKNQLAGCDYRYIIDASTTMQNDSTAEHEVYKEVLQTITAAPQLVTAVQANGKTLDIGELFKQFIISGGTKDWEKIIIDNKTEAQPADATAAALPAGQDPAQAQAPAQDQQAPGQMSMEQILSGQQPQPAPEAAPVDPTKDPNHEAIMKLFDKFPIEAQRAIVKSLGLPSEGMMPAEADMIDHLAGGKDNTIADFQPIIPEIDPNSPYGAAIDPHAHLANSQDPAVRDLYSAISSAGHNFSVAPQDPQAQAPAPAQPQAPQEPVPAAVGAPQ